MGDDPRVLRSLQDTQDLAWVHHVMPQTGESGGGLAGFQTGKVAMGGFGTWYLPQITRSGVPMTMAPWFQVGDNRPRVMFTLTAWSSCDGTESGGGLGVSEVYDHGSSGNALRNFGRVFQGWLPSEPSGLGSKKRSTLE